MVYAGQLALCSCLINCFEQGLSLYQSECTGAEAQIDFREPLPTHRAWCDDENTEIRRAQRLTRSHNGSILAATTSDRALRSLEDIRYSGDQAGTVRSITNYTHEDRRH